MTDDKDRGYIAAYEQARKPPLPPWDELPLPCAGGKWEWSLISESGPKSFE
jgi:hypothetical protein